MQMVMRKVLGLLAGVTVIAAGSMGIWGAGDQPAATATQKSPWVALPDSALTVKAGEGGKNLSIAGGAIAGIAVDRTNGDVYAVLRNKQGVVKSEDQGATFKDHADIGGQGPAYSASMNVDSAGKRVAVFTMYAPGGMTVDAGKTWRAFTSDQDMGKWFDFAAVDWEGGGKAIVGTIHEGQPRGHTWLSVDAGMTWKDLGTGFAEKGPLGIVDEKTLLTTKGKALQRSTDGGATWTKVAEVVTGGPKSPVNPVIYVVKGICYLMTENGLMVSKDKGATWAVQGAAVKANIGPFFGKDEDHLAAVGAEGCYETKDGGKTWTVMAPLPPGLGPRDVIYAWDPIHDIFYAAQSGKPAMKCVVGDQK